MPSDYERYHTHHRSRRHPDWDYTQSAAYFVTICTHQRAHLFGRVVDGAMRCTAFGRVAAEEWHRSEAIRDEVHLDAFVVMPNHIHGIVVIAPPDADAPTDPRGYAVRPADAPTPPDADPVTSSGRTTLPDQPRSPCGLQRRSLGSCIAGYKAAVTRRINQMRDTPGAPVWQRNYHDHIIRTAGAWHRIRRYIDTNPARWDDDTFYSAST